MVVTVRVKEPQELDLERHLRAAVTVLVDVVDGRPQIAPPDHLVEEGVESRHQSVVGQDLMHLKTRGNF